jgi:hypothetical protein
MPHRPTEVRIWNQSSQNAQTNVCTQHAVRIREVAKKAQKQSYFLLLLLRNDTIFIGLRSLWALGALGARRLNGIFAFLGTVRFYARSRAEL